MPRSVAGACMALPTKQHYPPLPSMPLTRCPPAQPAHQPHPLSHAHQLFCASDHSRRRWMNMRPIASWGEVKAVAGRKAQLTLHLKVNTCMGDSSSRRGRL